MTNTVPMPIVDEFEKLRQDYIRKLPEKIAAITDAWQPILRNAGEESHFVLLRSLLHKLVGSGGIFGMYEVSEIALILNSLCRKIQASGAPPSADQRRRIIAGLQSLSDSTTWKATGGLVSDDGDGRNCQLATD